VSADQTLSPNFSGRTLSEGLPQIITAGSTRKIQLSPPPDRTPRARKSDVTHTTTLGFAYVNEIGRSAFERQPFKFPVGSIIVRERLLPGSPAADQLVVMIKREKSFNRKGNGWEFLSVNGDATKILKREKDGKCLKCHASAKVNDFVFPEVKGP
jgi:hypothetical protein